MKIHIITETNIATGEEELQAVIGPHGTYHSVFVQEHDSVWAWENLIKTQPLKPGYSRSRHVLDTTY